MASISPILLAESLARPAPISVCKHSESKVARHQPLKAVAVAVVAAGFASSAAAGHLCLYETPAAVADSITKKDVWSFSSFVAFASC